MRNSMSTLLAILAAGALAACSGSDDDGPRRVQLFGTTVGDSQLVELDAVSGEVIATIGAVGYQVNGLEFDPTTGKLFATTSTNDSSFPNGLLEIDLTTGAGTPVGEGAGMMVNNLTVNAAGQLYAWTKDTEDLVTLDKATGVATRVAAEPYAAGISPWYHGMAFGPGDELILVDGEGAVYEIDAATGVATWIGDADVTAHHGDFHPVTGQYWGIDWGSEGSVLRILDFEARTVSMAFATEPDLFAVTFR